MNTYVPAIGMTCLGFFMAYISMYFVVRLKQHTVVGLSGVVGVLLGGVVGKLFLANSSVAPAVIWWYPIGLFVGLVAWGLLRALVPAHMLVSVLVDPITKG